MRPNVADVLRQEIREADRSRCAYCLTSEANSGIPLTIDHVWPLSKGGQTIYENLCLACRTCNEFKADRTEAEDPLTGDRQPLFNPRAQHWADHFAWSTDGTRIEGLTAIGRVTVVALRMNEAVIVSARRRWVVSGWHPSRD